MQDNDIIDGEVVPEVLPDDMRYLLVFTHVQTDGLTTAGTLFYTADEARNAWKEQWASDEWAEPIVVRFRLPGRSTGRDRCK